MIVLILVCVLVLAAAAAVWRWSVPPQEPPASEPDETAVRQHCRHAAQLQNFWAYDGSEQRDVEEVAEALYRKWEEREQ